MPDADMPEAEMPDAEVPEAEPELPAWLRDVPYVGSRFPGGAPRGNLSRGANCQLFAYEVLADFGYVLPDLRSDDLWWDKSATEAVDEPERLDLVLFNVDKNPYGAHVGVVWGPDAVLHLCKELARPAIWSWSQFSVRPRYQHIVGFKRPTARCTSRARGT